MCLTKHLEIDLQTVERNLHVHENSHVKSADCLTLADEDAMLTLCKHTQVTLIIKQLNFLPDNKKPLNIIVIT